MAWGWESKMWLQNQESSSVTWLKVVGEGCVCVRGEVCEVHSAGL